MPERPSSAGTRAREGDFQGVETPRPLVSAQKGAQTKKNHQKTSIDGAEKYQVSINHGEGVQEIRTGYKPPLRTDRDWVVGRGRQGGSMNGIIITEPRKGFPQGSTGTLATSRAEEGGRSCRGKGVRNRVAAWGCRCQEVTGE